MTDVSHLSIQELSELQSKVANQIAIAQKQSRKDGVKELHEVAKKYGYESAYHLLGVEADAKEVGKKERKTIGAKYRDLTDASKVWTGRGKQPLWVGTRLSEGYTLDQFLINQPTQAQANAA